MKPAGLLVVAILAIWNVAFSLTPGLGPWVPISVAAALADALALGLTPALRRVAAPTARQAGWGLGGAALQIGATYLLVGPALEHVPGLRAEVASLLALLGRPSGAQACLALPFIVLSEELIHRGAVQQALHVKLGTWGAVATAPVIYGAAHLASGSWALVGLALVCGLYWGALRTLSGGLFAPALCHLLWDGAVFLVWPLEA